MRLPARRSLWVVLPVWLILAGVARAQQPPGPIHPPAGTAHEKTPDAAAPPAAIPKNAPRLRIRVDEIVAPVTVRNSKGEMILDLQQKDFHVFDNGVEQPVEHFDLGGDPLAVALLVETSSRVESLLPAVRSSAIVFTEAVMGRTADAAVISYNDSIDLLRNFTSDPDSVEDTIKKLHLGTSGARLYDGISKAVYLLQKQPARERRVLLIVGEAVDTGSEVRLGEALRDAQLSNVTIYTIGLSTTAAEFRNPPKQYQAPQIGPPGTFPLPTPAGEPPTPQAESRQYGNIDLLSLAIWIVQHASNEVKNQALEVAAAATGGMHVGTLRDRSIEKAMDAIGGELHAQYTLGYRPPGDEPSGFHEIKVSVTRPGVKVRTRPGYYLPPPEPAS